METTQQTPKMFKSHRSYPIGKYHPIIAKLVKWTLKKLLRNSKLSIVFRGRRSKSGQWYPYGSIPLPDSKKYALYLKVEFNEWA